MVTLPTGEVNNKELLGMMSFEKLMRTGEHKNTYVKYVLPSSGKAAAKRLEDNLQNHNNSFAFSNTAAAFAALKFPKVDPKTIAKIEI